MSIQKNEYSYYNDTFGEIKVALNVRAKRFIIRMKEQRLHITMPAQCDIKELDNLLRDNKEELLKIVAKHNAEQVPNPLFTEGKMWTYTFVVELLPQTDHKGLVFRLHNGTLSIRYPSERSLTEPQLQHQINKVIDRYLNLEARRVLIPMTLELCKELNLTLHQVKISSSRSRWGSCTAQRNINLSMYLLTKPKHLIEYVIKHELAHLTEMNHSPRFWTLLDRYCQGPSLQLRKELNSGSSVNE